MSRRRYISTNISADLKVDKLVSEHGYLAALLYTWAIPHADDSGRLTGEAREFKLLVCPGFPATSPEIDEALNRIAEVGLWARESVDGRLELAFPADTWFKYQSYIGQAKRPKPENAGERRVTPETTAQERKTPRTTARSRATPENAASLSSSLSLSPVRSKDSPPGGDSYPPEFEAFWMAYPRTKEKHAAFLKWKTTLKNNTGLTAEQLVEAARGYAAQCRAEGTEGGFIKLAKTFLGPGKHWKEALGAAPPLPPATPPRPESFRPSQGTIDSQARVAHLDYSQFERPFRDSPATPSAPEPEDGEPTA